MNVEAPLLTPGFTQIAEKGRGFKVIDNREAVEVLIYDEIFSSGCAAYATGICADDIIKALAPYRNRKIVVRINSPGGDIWAGLALYNNLRGLDVTTVVDGIAASAASVVALAGRTVVMPRSATILIHNPTGLVIGEARDMRDMAGRLDRARNQLVDIYVEETGNSPSQVIGWMDAETEFTGQEAFEAGFVDQVSDLPAQPIPAAFINRLRRKTKQSPSAAAGGIENHNSNMNNNTSEIAACGCGGGPKTATLPPVAEDKTLALTRERDALLAKVEELTTQLRVREARDQASLKQRAIIEIDAAVAEGRIPEPLREKMVAAFIEDETGTRALIAQLKPSVHAHPIAGTSPLNIRNNLGIPTIQDRIKAEKDPQRRIQMLCENWDSIADGTRPVVS